MLKSTPNKRNVRSLYEVGRKHLSLSLLLACFSVSFAWGEDVGKVVIDCANENCGTSKGESKFFALPIYFHNVSSLTFSNNGTMTFKNPVYFSADDKDAGLDNRAEFSNNGVMNFGSNAVFQLLINVNGGILNFNADMGDDTFYAAVSGNIFNDGTINANGQIGFSAAKGDDAYDGWRVIVNNESGTFNVNGKTKIEQVVYNVGSFYIYNDTAFEQVLHNFNGGLLVAQRPTSVTYWLNNQDGATLHIKGTTLMINTINNDGVLLAEQGTFWNFRGANLIFSAVNGTLGQLIGNFINYGDASGANNDEGKVQVDVTGLMAGQKYQIIKGDSITLNEKDVSFLYGTGQYLGNGWVLINSTLFNQNQAVIKNAIESKNAGNPSYISKAVFDTETMLKTSLISQPKTIMNTLKTQIPTDTPLNSAYISRLTASSKAIMNDSSNFINPLERKSQTQFFATHFGGVLAGENLNGTLFGMSVGLTHIDDEYIAQGHFAYAKGKSTQDLSTQSTELNANLFQVGGFARLFFYEKLETDFNTNFIYGKFELNNAWLDVLPWFSLPSLNSSSNFNNYQANVGAVVGWRFGNNFSIKPFVGVQAYYENQGEFKQESGLELTSEAYSSLVFDALAGLETRYIFDNGSFIFAKASYENKLYNSHKEVFMRIADESLKYENESYDSVISANLGARLLSTKSFKLDIEALFKHYGNGVDYFGGNLGVRVRF